MLKILLRIGIFAALVAVLYFVKTKYFPRETAAAPAPATNGKPAPAIAIGATGYVVKGQKLDNQIFATGTILPNESVDLKTEVPGKIITLNIAEGKAVTKGQLLIKLNDADLLAQIKKIEAQLRLAETQRQRLQKLLEVKGVSQEEYDLVDNQISAYRADIEYYQAQIAKTELRAPMSGIIGLRSVSVGSYVNATTPIAMLMQTNPAKIDFSVPEKYANQVKIGDNVHFSVEGDQTKYTAKVYAAEAQIDPNTRTLKLRATANNPNGKIRAGAFAKVDLQLAEQNNAMMIPTESLVPILKGQQVFVSKNGLATVMKVEIGVRSDANIQIISGLSVGDTVITSGLMGIKPNAPVKFSKIVVN
jgi:membrane fusion protein, multidrug efflux system